MAARCCTITIFAIEWGTLKGVPLSGALFLVIYENIAKNYILPKPRFFGFTFLLQAVWVKLQPR